MGTPFLHLSILLRRKLVVQEHAHGAIADLAELHDHQNAKASQDVEYSCPHRSTQCVNTKGLNSRVSGATPRCARPAPWLRTMVFSSRPSGHKSHSWGGCCSRDAKLSSLLDVWSREMRSCHRFCASGPTRSLIVWDEKMSYQR